MPRQWPLPNRFRIRLTFESDWHVGSGMGRPGNIDRLIVRDADDLPFVPAKTLSAIWRDACELLCHGLDDGKVGPWTKFVDRIFGSQPALGPGDPTGWHREPANPPIQAAVQIHAARLPVALRARLAGPQRRLMRQTLTFVKPGVMIDCASGSAKTEFLRFEEVARKGTILEASCGLNAPEGPAREAASALLVASAMLVERLGGKRRRGSGRCRLEIIDADTATALDWLKRTTSPPDWPAAPGNGTVTDVQQAVPATGAWVAVPLALRLNGPLAVSYRTVGNVVETLDFVPGSYLLPHVTGQWPQLRPHVAAGEVVVLPAYLEVDGERGLPVPIAWFQPKDAGKDAAVETHPSWINRLVQAEPPGEIQFKQLREGYISAESKPPRKPPPTVRTHNTVDDRHQRPTPEAGGGVYSYEAIAPTDQDKPVVLRSELRLKKSLAEQLGANWWRKLDGEVALGRSKKDDYGSVTLETREPTEFRSTAAARSDRLLFVWIVSDTLLRNERLKPEPTAAVLARELGRKLGVRLSLRASNPQSGLLDEMVRVRRLDSWHVGWGLPRPTLIALQAGSCVVFQAEGDLDPAKLAQLEASGVGERTAEGYGQVRFNDRRLTEPPPPRSQDRQLAATQPDTPHSKDLPSMDASTQEYAWRIESECWKQEIRRKCLAIAADSTKRRELLGWVARGQQGQPPMSQLGGLRGQLTFLRSRADRKQVTDWLEHLEQNPRRAEKWPSIKSVKKFLTEDSAIWQVIDPHSWPTLTEGAHQRLQKELWALAVRTFFDACIRAHKRELEQEQS